MPANYDNAAWFYDRLSRLVYGRTLINAQAALLHLIPAGSKVLVAGGGTGQILEEISKIHSSGLTIAYVELSENMLALSKKRNFGNNTVSFINSPVEEAALAAGFDVIITAFLFDNFLPVTLNRVFYHLHHLLKTSGLWINTDFQLTGKWWQVALLKSMYLFFKVLGCMETQKLSDIKPYFKKVAYRVITEKLFFGDFIGTTAYRKE